MGKIIISYWKSKTGEDFSANTEEQIQIPTNKEYFPTIRH
jgi:hypothetical protein